MINLIFIIFHLFIKVLGSLFGFFLGHPGITYLEEMTSEFRPTETEIELVDVYSKTRVMCLNFFDYS